MIPALKKLLLACALAAAALAAWAGPIVDVKKIDALQPGKTTLDTVLANFGKAEQEEHSPDGRSVYLYSYDFTGQDPAQTGGLTTGKIALLFGPDGRFEGARFYGQAASQAPGASQ
jgi:hypothetical protein